jgi:hypothetical protein
LLKRKLKAGEQKGKKYVLTAGLLTLREDPKSFTQYVGAFSHSKKNNNEELITINIEGEFKLFVCEEN